MSIYQGNKKVLGGVSNIEENKVKEIIDSERPITTTIDSTSTDVQIPSAKSVFNSTIGESILSTDKYGNDMLSYPCGLYRFGLDTVVRSMVNTPCNISGVLLVTSQQSDPERNITTDTKVYREYAYIDYNGNAYIRALRTGDTAGVITVDSGWQKVCTTKVADASSITEITFINTTNYSSVNNNCKYFIKNGICTMMLYVNCVTPSNSWVTIANVPKPANFEVAQMLGNETSIMKCLIKTDGDLQLSGGTASTTFIATISYPVAES